MPKTPDSFAQHALDELQPLGNVTLRPLFGAWCLYLDGNPLGLVDEGRLYLKVDDTTKPVFAAAGGQPFTYFHKGKNTQVEMSYRTVPDADLDDRAALMQWARMAADVARSTAKPAKARALPKARAKVKAKPAKAKARAKTKRAR